MFEKKVNGISNFISNQILKMETFTIRYTRKYSALESGKNVLKRKSRHHKIQKIRFFMTDFL